MRRLGGYNADGQQALLRPRSASEQEEAEAEKLVSLAVSAPPACAFKCYASFFRRSCCLTRFLSADIPRTVGVETTATATGESPCWHNPKRVISLLSLGIKHAYLPTRQFVSCGSLTAFVLGSMTKSLKSERLRQQASALVAPICALSLHRDLCIVVASRC